jgi:hypothetical protein
MRSFAVSLFVEGNNDVTTATIAKIAQARGLKLELK